MYVCIEFQHVRDQFIRVGTDRAMHRISTPYNMYMLVTTTMSITDEVQISRMDCMRSSFSPSLRGGNYDEKILHNMRALTDLL